MGKKGTLKNQNNPNALKEAGNKAFVLKQFEEAITLYSKAIHLDDTNHVYYANRKSSKSCALDHLHFIRS